MCVHTCISLCVESQIIAIVRRHKSRRGDWANAAAGVHHSERGDSEKVERHMLRHIVTHLKSLRICIAQKKNKSSF